MAELTKYQITKRIRGAVYRNRELCRFLKKNKAFTAFIENLVDSILKENRNIDYTLRKISRGYHTIYTILVSGFKWNNTKQGYEYWSSLYDKTFFII